MTTELQGRIKAIKGAFGAKNRNRLIDEYFHSIGTTFDPSVAWSHVYRLLLWADQTTGLAHCYESDKSQPGKNWYARSLAFHDWLSTAIDIKPTELANEIDWLFRHATEDLAAEAVRGATRLAAAAAKQLAPYHGREFPKPGEDPELISIIREVLGDQFNSEPTTARWQLLVQRVRQYLALENKRKNLVGEGFEDVLSHVVRRTCNLTSLKVFTRRPLHEIPGFNRARRGEKPNKVDVAVIGPSMRTLNHCKMECSR